MGRSDWPEKLFDNIKMRAGEKTAVTVRIASLQNVTEGIVAVRYVSSH